MPPAEGNEAASLRATRHAIVPHLAADACSLAHFAVPLEMRFSCSYFVDTSGFQGFCSLIYLPSWATRESLRVCVKAWHEGWAMNKSAVSKPLIYSFRRRSSLTLLRLVPRRHWQHIGLLSQRMQTTRQMFRVASNVSSLLRFFTCELSVSNSRC